MSDQTQGPGPHKQKDISRTDDTASPRERMRDLEQRIEGLQVRYELACNGRREAEARLNVALDTIADLKEELNTLGYECMVLRDQLKQGKTP